MTQTWTKSGEEVSPIAQKYCALREEFRLGGASMGESVHIVTAILVLAAAVYQLVGLKDEEIQRSLSGKEAIKRDLGLD